MSTDSDIIESTNHNFTYKNPYKIMTIIFAVIVFGLAGLTIYLFVDNSDKFKQIADLRAFIASLDNGTSSNERTGDEPTGGSDHGSDAEYTMLPNVGIMLSLPSYIEEKLNIVEVDDNSYRFEVKKINEYREQGYCGNGGSNSVGIIRRKDVKVEPVTKSQWSDHTITKFQNEVVYPEEYVSFTNLDAVCSDSKDGHEQRLQEVAEEVQTINDALEQALLNTMPIDED